MGTHNRVVMSNVKGIFPCVYFILFCFFYHSFCSVITEALVQFNDFLFLCASLQAVRGPEGFLVTAVTFFI